MTRINLTPVSDLYDQHLLAEHREIKRIPSVIKKWKYNLEWQPTSYTMWTWHVKFFYDKLEFLKNRYIELYRECNSRWFKVENYIDNWDDIDLKLCNDYIPTKEDIKVSQQRLNEKYRPNFYRYKWILI